jgi:phosphoribosylamine--glycine ligase
LRVLVVGSGGREHALAWALARSDHEVHSAPGNPGTGSLGDRHDVRESDIDGIRHLARRLDARLVVPGPEAPLVAGLADALRSDGSRVFGPGADGARIEGSKSFAKEIMRAAGVRTAEARLCTGADEVRAAVGGAWGEWVLKADGLAGGKGVFLPEDGVRGEEALAALGAGARVVVERRLSGPEVSVMALCGGGRASVLPPGRDHKRVGDGDRGPNTGGMGAVCPAPGLPGGFAEVVLDEVVLPVLAELGRRGIDYRGLLYAGMILDPGGPSVLEFNCRFGDPEAQATVPLLSCDLGEVLLACAEGSTEAPGAVAMSAACVVMASKGYPGPSRPGAPIHDPGGHEDAVVFHAGTTMQEGRLVTSGGRVLGVTGWGPGLEDATGRAYEAVGRIGFDGAFWRSDIGRTT